MSRNVLLAGMVLVELSKRTTEELGAQLTVLAVRVAGFAAPEESMSPSRRERLGRH